MREIIRGGGEGSLSMPRFSDSEVCRFLGLSIPRFVDSEVCRFRGLSLPAFVFPTFVSVSRCFPQKEIEAWKLLISKLREKNSREFFFYNGPCKDLFKFPYLLSFTTD